LVAQVAYGETNNLSSVGKWKVAIAVALQVASRIASQTISHVWTYQLWTMLRLQEMVDPCGILALPLTNAQMVIHRMEQLEDPTRSRCSAMMAT
jgi:hypothetical protein